MTPQEVFDKVVSHLRTQGKRAEKDLSLGKTICQYRTEDGLKCAVGCLIEDEEYSKNLEGVRVYSLFDEEDRWVGVAPRSFKIRLKAHVELLASLQRVHDSDAPSEWENGLAQVAVDYNLTYTPKTV